MSNWRPSVSPSADRMPDLEQEHAFYLQYKNVKPDVSAPSLQVSILRRD